MSQLWKIKMLNHIDNEISKLQDEKRALKTSEPIEDEIEKLKRELKQAIEQKQEKDLEIKRKELEVGKIAAHRESIEKKLYGGQTTNPKELQGWKAEVDYLKRKQDELEDEILEIMEEVENKEKNIEAKENKIKQKEKEAKEVSRIYKSESQRIHSKLDELKEKRSKMVESIDKNDLQKYEQVRKMKGGSAVAEVKGEHCGSCNMKIPRSILNQVKNKELIKCSACSRILYHGG